MPEKTPCVNLLCLLPDGYIPVQTWAPHPCDGWYVIEAWCYGANGRLGYWMDGAPSLTYAR